MLDSLNRCSPSCTRNSLSYKGTSSWKLYLKDGIKCLAKKSQSMITDKTLSKQVTTKEEIWGTHQLEECNNLIRLSSKMDYNTLALLYLLRDREKRLSLKILKWKSEKCYSKFRMTGTQWVRTKRNTMSILLWEWSMKINE